jgi:competence protein ComEA
MNHSNLIQCNTRTALAAWEVMSFKRWAGAFALMLMLVLVVLAGSPTALAQQQKPVAAAADKPAVTTVNINSADAQTLAAKLKGVGETRAAEIVRHRETYGPFASAEELTEVKGIGQSTLDMNRDVITLE